LNGRDLNYVTELKYLGHLITNDECDDKDILREVRAICLHARTYWLADSVCFHYQLKLFCLEHFVMCFYGMELGVVILCVLQTGCGLVI